MPVFPFLLRVERFVTKDGSLEMAVALLYQVNYIGPPYRKEDADIFQAIVKELKTDLINHSDCLLVDPKLLRPFFSCFRKEAALDLREALTEDVADVENDDPFAAFVAFNTQNNLRGLMALWLWQCQYLIIGELQYSWAAHV